MDRKTIYNGEAIWYHTPSLLKEFMENNSARIIELPRSNNQASTSKYILDNVLVEHQYITYGPPTFPKAIITLTGETAAIDSMEKRILEYLQRPKK